MITYQHQQKPAANPCHNFHNFVRADRQCAMHAISGYSSHLPSPPCNSAYLPSSLIKRLELCPLCERVYAVRLPIQIMLMLITYPGAHFVLSC
jgi:hypothetical protein